MSNYKDFRPFVSYRAALFLLICAYLLQTPLAATHLDVARDMFVATRLLHGAEYPWSGPILAGTIHLGPVWYWLLALLLGAAGSWLGTLFLLAILCATQFPLAYLLGKELQSRRAGMLWATGLILPSWSTFEQLLPLHYELTSALTLAFLLCALRYWRQPRRRYLAGIAIFFVLAVHAHPACISLIWIAAPLLVWACYTRRCSPTDLMLAVLIGCLPLLPYVMWDARQDFADFRAGMNYLNSGEKTGSLSTALPLFWASAIGGTRYWLSALLGLPAPVTAIFTAAIGSCGLLGLSGLGTSFYNGRQRALIVVILSVALAILFTTSLIRAAAPFYMSTQLHLVLAGIVAIGLDQIGESLFSRAARTLIVAVSVLASSACTICFAQFQISGNWPFNFLPLYNVTAAAGPTTPFLLMPAYAMAESGQFLCSEGAPAAHGALARHLLYDYAIEMQLTCGRNDAEIGGNEPGRHHWVGLPRAILSDLHVTPTRYIGPMGVMPAKPISDEPAIAEPSTPLYPNYLPKIKAESEKRYRILLGQSEHIAVSNMVFFVPDPQVTVTINDRNLEPQTSDMVSRIYSCAGCTNPGGTEATLSVKSSDQSDVDIVVF
jgi:hypothetical protein